jgi:hypothetical protein
MGQSYQECVTAGEPLGNLESGLAAALTGSVRIAIVSGGVACLAGAVAVTLALPALWRYDARAVPAPGRAGRRGARRAMTLDGRRDDQRRAGGGGRCRGEGAGPLGICPETSHQRIEQMIGRGRRDPSGQAPFTPCATRVLELALREANDLHDGSVDTAHLVLGLIRERDVAAARVLVELTADPKRVRQQVIQLAQAR